MKNPITARRERRILAALAVLGPTDEFALYTFLNAPSRTLTAALLSLATKGLVTCDNRPSIIGATRLWQLAETETGA